jgi:hypothetical protein
MFEFSIFKNTGKMLKIEFQLYDDDTVVHMHLVPIGDAQKYLKAYKDTTIAFPTHQSQKILQWYTATDNVVKQPIRVYK